MKQLNISISKAYSQKRQGTKDASVVYGTFYSPPLEVQREVMSSRLKTKVKVRQVRHEVREAAWEGRTVIGFHMFQIN